MCCGTVSDPAGWSVFSRSFKRTYQLRERRWSSALRIVGLYTIPPSVQRLAFCVPKTERCFGILGLMMVYDIYRPGELGAAQVADGLHLRGQKKERIEREKAEREEKDRIRNEVERREGEKKDRERMEFERQILAQHLRRRGDKTKEETKKRKRREEESPAKAKKKTRSNKPCDDEEEGIVEMEIGGEKTGFKGGKQDKGAGEV
ncbi:hypothetical protein J6590_042543 [Homalodisca vitripennis]|nr:hypothetical protein J6590_042543 [Homalodisca vitripennis]